MKVFKNYRKPLILMGRCLVKLKYNWYYPEGSNWPYTLGNTCYNWLHCLTLLNWEGCQFLCSILCFIVRPYHHDLSHTFPVLLRKFRTGGMVTWSKQDHHTSFRSIIQVMHHIFHTHSIGFCIPVPIMLHILNPCCLKYTSQWVFKKWKRN